MLGPKLRTQSKSQMKVDGVYEFPVNNSTTERGDVPVRHLTELSQLLPSDDLNPESNRLRRIRSDQGSSLKDSNT